MAVLTSSESCKAGGTHGPWVKDMGWSLLHQHLVSKVNCPGRGTYAELKTDQMQHKCICGGLAAVTKGQPSQESPGVHIPPAPAVPAPEAPDWVLPPGPCHQLCQTGFSPTAGWQRLQRGAGRHWPPAHISGASAPWGFLCDTAIFLLQTLLCHNLAVKLGEQ